jgi:hypothetical protein
MVFRCNLDGSELETLGWNFRNNYEVAVDSFGTLWQSDNDDDGNRGVRINYVMEFGNYGYTDEITGAGWSQGWKKAQEKGAKEEERPIYHWHLYDPGVVPNLLQTGNGSPTGIAVYEGSLLPDPFRNQVIHCDAGPRVVRAYPVTASGAGYTAGNVNILTTEDSWYRPSDVCVGPDGALYIADWHDAGVGGHNMADRVLETMTGRIYRVAPKGNRPSIPKVDVKSAAGAVTAEHGHALPGLDGVARHAGQGREAAGEALEGHRSAHARPRLAIAGAHQGQGAGVRLGRFGGSGCGHPDHRPADRPFPEAGRYSRGAQSGQRSLRAGPSRMRDRPSAQPIS